MAVIDVVKYNGSPDVFAWKYPSEELSTWTQLIVNESQEAVLFKGGQALDIFKAGTYTLDTKNIPILNKLINLPFGGRSPFTAEVWFVNKIVSLDIKWGTPTPIQLQDPKYKVFIPLRSFGQFGIQIDDSKKFLTSLVGTLPSFTKENIINYFRGVYLTKAKDSISTYLIKKQISVLEINAYLDELSEFLKERITPSMNEFGIKLVNFYVNDINVPESDPAVIKLKNALAKRAEMDIVGYDYAQERSFDTLEGAATNKGSNQANFMGAGIGLGMGAGLGRIFGTEMKNISGSINVEALRVCPNCKNKTDLSSKFCNHCGFNMSNTTIHSSTNNNGLIKCNNCGKEYSNNVKFCPECGDSYNPCSSCHADMPKDATKCPICGKEAPTSCSKCGNLIEGTPKFCPECGNTLTKTCSSCGTIIDGTPKFCPECGGKL